MPTLAFFAASLLLADPSLTVVRVADGKLLRQTGPLTPPARPGSTLKPFTLYTLLHQNGFVPSRRIACPGKLTLAGRRLDCTHGPAIPAVDASEALAYSCNHYFTHWARELNEATWRQTLTRFHLTANTPYTPDQRALQAIGEWGIEVTPATLAEAYRRLALEEDEPLLAPLFAGLRLATRQGTAQLAGPEFAGKTGTAATPSRLSLQAWFAGFTPPTHPQQVVVVFVPQGRGATDAAPVARKALRP